MYRSIAPMLLVDEVKRGIRFCREILGARLAAVHPEKLPHEWATLKFGEVEIMLWRKDGAREEYPGLEIPESPASFIAYVYVDDVDDLYERVKGKAEVLMEPKDQFYGLREFTIRDPYGFVFTFAQELEGPRSG